MKKSIAIAVCLLGAAGLYWAVQAGNLEPSDPPAPTMKRLVEVPPTWSQRLDSTNGSTVPLWEGCGSSRFLCVMPEGSPFPVPQAVLDHETGLVWERAPTSGVQPWFSSYITCRDRTTGNRRGWRLPALEELASLVDASESDPALPPGHPFLNLTEEGYWSSSTSPAATHQASRLWLASGNIVNTSKDNSFGAWCVRGGPPNSFTSQPNDPSP
jgi:hypothetical protein